MLSLDEGGEKFLSVNFRVLRIIRFVICLKNLFQIYPRWFLAPTFIHFVASFSSSNCFPAIIIMKIYLMQVCNMYVMISIALCQVQAYRMLTFVTVSRSLINFIRYLYLTHSVRFKGIYGKSFLEANLLL